MKVLLLILIIFLCSCQARTVNEDNPPTGITKIPVSIRVLTENGPIDCFILMEPHEYKRITTIYPCGIPNDYFDIKIL